MPDPTLSDLFGIPLGDGSTLVAAPPVVALGYWIATVPFVKDQPLPGTASIRSVTYSSGDTSALIAECLMVFQEAADPSLRKEVVREYVFGGNFDEVGASYLHTFGQWLATSRLEPAALVRAHTMLVGPSSLDCLAVFFCLPDDQQAILMATYDGSTPTAV